MLATTLTYAFNQVLKENRKSEEIITQLKNKVLSIQCKTPLPITLQCTINNDNEALFTIGESAKENARITGTMLQFLRTSILNMNTSSYKTDDLTIEGDIDLAKNWLRLLRSLDIDLGELLSKLIGDVPAEKTMNLLQLTTGFFRKNIHSFEHSLKDYLHEEINLFPDQASLELFFERVDKLREDSDRLIVKVNLLEKDLRKSS